MAEPIRLSFEDEIRRNKLKSALLMTLVILGFIVLGFVISLAVDPSYFFIIMIFAVIFSTIYTIYGYYNSDKVALASVHAQMANMQQHSALINAVEDMSIASGLPMPKVYVMESEQINAFASGRDPKHAVICVTTGAIKKLNKQELEGVIGHEMGHVANYDIRFMTLTAVLVGLVSIVSQLFLRNLWLSGNNRNEKNGGNVIILVIAIVFAILAPIATQLVSLAISRKREFGADATSVKLTRYSPGLRSALEKIKKESVIPQDSRRYSKAVAPLFISDPFKNKIQNLFSTHPSLDERIRRLDKM
jgi:heat shock protein HtpX